MSDTILLVKIVSGKKITDIISAYASDIRLNESNKYQFLEDPNKIPQEIPFDKQ